MSFKQILASFSVNSPFNSTRTIKDSTAAAHKDKLTCDKNENKAAERASLYFNTGLSMKNFKKVKIKLKVNI